MDFGAMLQMLQQQPLPVNVSAPPLASMPGGLTSANVSQFAPGQMSGQSPFAMLGNALQSNSGGQYTQPMQPMQPDQHRSQFLMSFLPQLMQSIGQHNMLGRIGQ